MFVATKRFTLRQFLEAEKYEKFVAKNLYVATQETRVVTRTRLLHQNYVATLSKSIETKSKKNLRKPIATKTVGYGRSYGTKTKTLL